MSAETAFSTFYKDLKATEKADAVLTPKQQIERLLRPGCTYRNLNPYEVLQIDPETPIEDIRRKYRRLSILVHPDKNQDDVERAQAAFDAVKKSYALLDDEKTRKKCEEIVDEAKGRTQQNMEEKRRKLIKENKARGLPTTGDHIKVIITGVSTNFRQEKAKKFVKVCLQVVQISLQFDDFFFQSKKYIISRGFQIFNKSFLHRTCWNTLFLLGFYLMLTQLHDYRLTRMILLSSSNPFTF